MRIQGNSMRSESWTMKKTDPIQKRQKRMLITRRMVLRQIFLWICQTSAELGLKP